MQVRDRALRCRHGEKANSKVAKNYEPTRWGRQLAPRYPDVPHALEGAFRRKQYLHFLDWGAGDTAERSASAVSIHFDSAPQAAPIEVARTHRGNFGASSGPCSQLHGCPLTTIRSRPQILGAGHARSGR